MVLLVYIVLPCEDVLRMIIPEVDLGGSADGDALGLVLHNLEEIRLCAAVSKLDFGSQRET